MQAKPRHKEVYDQKSLQSSTLYLDIDIKRGEGLLGFQHVDMTLPSPPHCPQNPHLIFQLLTLSFHWVVVGQTALPVIVSRTVLSTQSVHSGR